MKLLFSVCTVMLFPALFWGCFPGKEFQVELSDVKLIRVDTLWRSQNTNCLQLTWESRRRMVNYISYQPLENNPFYVGMRMQVFRIK